MLEEAVHYIFYQVTTVLNRLHLAALGLSTALITSAIAYAPSAKAESIDTTSSWNTVTGVSPWSPAGTESYGQIITPTAGGNLTDFTFYINPSSAATPIAYQARVYQWDYTGGPGVWGPTGASLYNSGTLFFSGTPGTFSPLTIATGGVPLSTGIPYVLFLSTVGETNAFVPSTQWGFISSDVYAGGDFVFSNNPGSFTDPWDSFFGTGTELAFKANITTEAPGPLPLLGAAAAFSWSRRIRRRLATDRSSLQLA